MRLISLLLQFLRALARILHGQRARNDEHFAQTLVVAPGQDHARHARVQRQAGHLLAQRRQRIFVVDGTEFLQKLVAIGNRSTQRRFDERELLDVRQPQRLHAQDHRRQR